MRTQVDLTERSRRRKSFCGGPRAELANGECWRIPVILPIVGTTRHGGKLHLGFRWLIGETTRHTRKYDALVDAFCKLCGKKQPEKLAAAALAAMVWALRLNYRLTEQEAVWLIRDGWPDDRLDEYQETIAVLHSLVIDIPLSRRPATMHGPWN